MNESVGVALNSLKGLDSVQWGGQAVEHDVPAPAPAPSAPHPFRPGDYFEESWGYDQTNVDFYEVVRVSAKSVWVRHVPSRVVDGRVVPGEYVNQSGRWERRRGGGINSPEGAVKRVRRDNWRGEVSHSLHMTSYSSAYPWDGKPSYDTIAAGGMGH